MNPRIEEVSESDSEPSEVDISEVPSLIRASDIPASAQVPQHLLQPQSHAVRASPNRERSKHYQCLYPVYFDRSRTRAEGRRVGQALAVDNPLAREMADAAASLGLETALEPDKVHPKDWSNPGRIRVLLKQNGKLMHRDISNKHHLYILMAQYLKKHPTNKDTPLKLRIAGLPLPKDSLPVPAVPKGWKMNSILPLHSPALSGGGVQENFLQEMMAEMQGEAGAGGSGSGSGADNKKRKEKKKK
ncbi:signal recognition particle, SRP19 subunit [Westerdykella ornata]|uniref:Signal recognition particle, SRP19 subunit n=1 Tax=Westerdykella ornata TaxID=318751 RepID=A0A6A6JDI7_WESOR|nr:signal recognition particle, SRP19 subunit [Westerdykella ornata]KAF2274621.1 signal recognition particle, SRP19 subunit [Westerdykella ornata]